MKNNQVPLSVVLITYNHRNTIEKAMDSVLAQETDFDFEFVVGEDHSKDGTREIVIDYQKKYPEKFRLIISDENVGPQKNTKRVMNACKGKFLAFIEGDDYWTDPKKLQKQYDFLNTHPEYAMVHTNYDVFYEQDGNFDRNIHSSMHGRSLEGKIYDDLLRYNFIGTCTVLIRSELAHRAIQDLKLYDGGWQMGDRPLWLEIARQYEVGYLPDSTAVYRINKGSMSHSHFKHKTYKFFESSYTIRLWFIEKHGCSDETREIVLNDFNSYKLEYGYLLNRKELADEAVGYFKSNKAMNFSRRLYHFGSRSLLCKAAVKAVFLLHGRNPVSDK